MPDRRRRLLILGICSLSLLIVGLDTTIVNVALPAIHRSLHASLSGLQWTVDAYTLVLGSLLMLSGSTADRLGRRRVFQTGLSLFSLGSLLCALAPSLPVLIGARVLQAIGGSMLNPVAMSIIRNVFEDPRERARAIGVWGALFGTSMALGPVVGGALVDSISWRAVFLVNVPIGLAAIALTARYVPESRAARARRIDPGGQLLVVVGLAAVTYAIIQAPAAGWLSAQTLGLGALGLCALAGLVAYERRRTEPLLEIGFFHSVPFSGASATAVGAFVALGGFLFLNTLYLQEVRGLSPLEAGLWTLPMAGTMILFAPISGRLVAARGTRVSLVTGSCALIAGGAILAGLGAHTPFGVLAIAYVLFGAGSGLINTPITDTAVAGMPPSQAGVAAAVASASRQVGTTLGVAVLGALAGGAAGAVGPGFPAATHSSWLVVVALGVAMLVLGVLTSTAWAQRTAARTAERFSDPAHAGGDDTGSAGGPDGRPGAGGEGQGGPRASGDNPALVAP
ncbi:MAG: DHA2 family efflux MFS transporter permease subunit [Solirubrobacteraceae bacterium]